MQAKIFKSRLKKPVLIILSLMLVFLLLPRQVNKALAWYCRSSSINAASVVNMRNSMCRGHRNTTTNQPTATAVAVSVMDNSFSPRTITVPAGSTVTWTNRGAMMHTVTADNGAFDSGTLNPGTSFSQTFNTPGSFPYFCRFHGGPNGSGMSGMVVVISSSGSMNMPANNNTYRSQPTNYYYPNNSQPTTYYSQQSPIYPNYFQGSDSGANSGIGGSNFAQQQFDAYYGQMYPNYQQLRTQQGIAGPANQAGTYSYPNTNSYTYPSYAYPNNTAYTYPNTAGNPASGANYAQQQFDAYYSQLYPNYQQLRIDQGGAGPENGVFNVNSNNNFYPGY